jgi:hypothetical protein
MVWLSVERYAEPAGRLPLPAARGFASENDRAGGVSPAPTGRNGKDGEIKTSVRHLLPHDCSARLRARAMTSLLFLNAF